jgi:DNA-binding HxlR family transcriptional regulator
VARSYGQYCSLARALDVIGDRWNILIVRELLLRGPCRYSDLQHGLPGIATNLLADRLARMEADGVVVREHAPPPIAATLYRLTEWGEQLRPILTALGRWGVPLMTEPAEDASFRPHWLALPVELFLHDSDPAAPPIAIELRTDGGATTIRAEGGTVRAEHGPTQEPDLVVSGRPQVVLGLLSGRLGLADAKQRGLECAGDAAVLARVVPAAA